MVHTKSQAGILGGRSCKSGAPVEIDFWVFLNVYRVQIIGSTQLSSAAISQLRSLQCAGCFELLQMKLLRYRQSDSHWGGFQCSYVKNETITINLKGWRYRGNNYAHEIWGQPVNDVMMWKQIVHKLNSVRERKISDDDKINKWMRIIMSILSGCNNLSMILICSYAHFAIWTDGESRAQRKMLYKWSTMIKFW